jgi:hypothetical protein
MTAVGVLEGWTNFHTRMLAPDRQKNRLAGLDETSDSFNLFPTLEVLASDMRVKKIKAPSAPARDFETDLVLFWGWTAVPTRPRDHPTRADGTCRRVCFIERGVRRDHAQRPRYSAVRGRCYHSLYEGLTLPAEAT